MEKLEEAIRNLADEFNAVLESARTNIDTVAETSRDESLARLSKDQEDPNGVLAQAEHTRLRLETSIDEYKKFQRELAQLEQVYLISEDLKDVVRGLEKQK